MNNKINFTKVSNIEYEELFKRLLCIYCMQNRTVGSPDLSIKSISSWSNHKLP